MRLLGKKKCGATTSHCVDQFCNYKVSGQICRLLSYSNCNQLGHAISIICPSFCFLLTFPMSSDWWKFDNMWTHRVSFHFVANKPVLLVNYFMSPRFKLLSGLHFGVWQRLTFTVPTAWIFFSFNCCNSSTLLKRFSIYSTWFLISKCFGKLVTPLDPRHLHHLRHR